VPLLDHNRVKTWTSSVDLFQKNFIFVPIESDHWYLVVICFPGLNGQNPESPALSSTLQSEESVMDCVAE